METGHFIDQLGYLIPEIIITLFLVAIVLVDLFTDKSKVKTVTALALTGVVLAGIFVTGSFMSSASLDLSLSEGGMKLVDIDPFGNFFKLLILGSSLLILFFSATSEEIKETGNRVGEYYALMFGMILGMMFMVSSTDLILIYLAVELLSLSSFVLAGYTDKSPRNSEASLKYLLYGAASSGIMLFGISLLYGLTGTTSLYGINQALQGFDSNLLALSMATVFIIAGIGYKISAAPFHFWAPDVYEGSPLPITAYLSVASKAAGFALLIRFVRVSFVSFVDEQGVWDSLPMFDWQTVLIVLAIGTMTLANFTALWQNNMKRLLAYSSIAHAGYLLLGVAVMTEEGMTAVLIYFIIYLFMNLGAFYVVMVIAEKTGSENMEDYDGLGRNFPFLGVSLAIFLVSLTGLPPTAGFIGKLFLFKALIDAKMITVALIALLNTVVSLYYYIRVFKYMFLTEPSEKKEEDTPKTGLVFISLMLIPVLLFGIYFTPLVEFARTALQFRGF